MTSTLRATPEMVSCDWYGATVSDPRFSVDSLLPLLDEELRPAVAHHGYAHGWEARKGGRAVARVYEGGTHEHPHVVASGGDAGLLRDLLVGHGFEHSVARYDACVDFSAPGLFDRVREEVRTVVAGRATVTVITSQKPGAVEASTLSVGARRSEVYGRLYEKGKESPELNDPHRVRWEVELKPQSRARKGWAARTAPNDVLGAAQWSREVFREVFGGIAAAPPSRSRRVTDLEGSLNALVAQYGARLDELIALHAGDLGAAMADLMGRRAA